MIDPSQIHHFRPDKTKESPFITEVEILLGGIPQIMFPDATFQFADQDCSPVQYYSPRLSEVELETFCRENIERYQAHYKKNKDALDDCQSVPIEPFWWSAALQQLHKQLQKLCLSLGLNYTERADAVDDRREEVHLTFTYDEEDQVDRLIRAARVTMASFGPESFLPESHPNTKQFRHSEQVHYQVHKSLILSHMYWGLTFTLCSPEDRYSVTEDTQP